MAQQKPVEVAGLILKEGLDRSVTQGIVRKIVRAGIQTYTTDDLRSDGAIKVDGVDELKRVKPDVVISVGGDGTLLRTLRILGDETPVLAVNVGHRGILSEIKPDEIDSAAMKLRKGEYVLDRRMRIAAQSSVTLPPATNEIYVVRRRHIGTPLFTIALGGVPLTVKMDGVVVATPTGSTGHAYSLKGPVLQEDLNGVLIVPASPLQNIPPIVIKPQPISIRADQPTDIVVDGQELQPVEAGEEVKIFKYKYDANLVRFGRYAFKQLLKLIAT